MGNDNVQASQRWFDGIANGARSGESVATDASRLRCWHCDVQYMLKWNPVDKTFHTMPKNGVEDKTVTGTGTGAWGDCDHSSHGSQQVCEYSSGVCFVEERRTFGYITLVRKGCKQAKACYMNKYQNFLVQAGRQCWPGDDANVGMAVAHRPHDIKSDEWIYNLIRGADPTNFALTAASSASAESFKDVTFADDFDITFTDVSPGNVVNDSGRTKGFYINPNNITRPWPTKTVWSSPHGVTSVATVATIAMRTGSPRLSVIGPRIGSLVTEHPIPMLHKQNPTTTTKTESYQMGMCYFLIYSKTKTNQKKYPFFLTNLLYPTKTMSPLKSLLPTISKSVCLSI